MNITCEKPATIRYTKSGKIKIKAKNKNKMIPIFLLSVVGLSIGSIFILDINWVKLFSRFPDIGRIFYKLIQFNFNRIDLIASSFMETISIVVLSTFYSILLGLIFGMFAANNIFKIRFLPTIIKSFFTFLRAVPTPVWVLLMLVCLGFGPASGIAGLCVHTTAFFTKSFSQSFEDIDPDTIEALEVTGASRLQIFFSAILPSALTQIVAWIGMRFEINFSECAILGMVGAGGIGFVISTSIQGYDYGTAGLAIFIVFIFAYTIERLFARLKRIIK